MKNWKINSWRNYPVKHIPEYPDQKELDGVLSKIKDFPPLVFAGETRHLKEQLADVVDGKAFLLQGGDCAESFAEFHPDNIRDTFKLILQMSLVLTYSASLPVIKLGRIAGQFSKPRSSPVENIDGVELPSYLGDNINGMEFNEKSRVPDPKRLFKAYSQSASTLNLIRAFSHGGFADLKKVHTWNLGFIKNTPAAKKFKDLEDRIADAHPYGARPFKRQNYINKFLTLTDGILDKKESARFLKVVQNLKNLKAGELNKLNIQVKRSQIKKNTKQGIF